MIDMMAFIGANGHTAMYESASRTREAFRMSFQVYAMEITGQRGKEFWDSWKDNRARTQWENAMLRLQPPDRDVSDMPWERPQFCVAAVSQKRLQYNIIAF
jgi:hypothetical protein